MRQITPTQANFSELQVSKASTSIIITFSIPIDMNIVDLIASSNTMMYLVN